MGIWVNTTTEIYEKKYKIPLEIKFKKSMLKVEGILRKFIEDALEETDNQQLNINTMEKLYGYSHCKHYRDHS